MKDGGRRDNDVPLYAGLVFAILVVAVGLRLWNIAFLQFWEDDYLSLDRALMNLGRMFMVQKFQGPADTIFELQPPLFHAVLHFVLQAAKTESAARSVSLAAGAGAVLGVFFAGRSLFGRPAGLFAALLCALSLFHMEFSRAVKPYSLFLCCSVWALFFFYEALKSGRTGLWAAYALSAAAMLYSGYQGLPAFAAQGVFGAYWFFSQGGERAVGRRRGFIRFAAAMLVVIAAYLPWLEAVFFLRAFLHNPGVDPLAGLNFAFFSKIAAEFYTSVFPCPKPFLAAFLLVVLAGVASRLVQGRAKPFLLLLLWAGAPCLAVLSSQADHRTIVSSRHLVFLFFFLMFMAGSGVEALSTFVCRAIPAGRVRRRAALGAGLAACFALMLPDILAYGAFYRRQLSFDRDFFHWLQQHKNNVSGLDFTGYKRNTKRFAANWALPGLFEPAGSWARPGYRRVHLVENFTTGSQNRTPPSGGLLVEAFRTGIFNTRVEALGLVNRAPLALSPGKGLLYRDEFKTFRFYEDAFAAKNTTLDRELGLLRPARYSKPAAATYAFVLPPGAAVRKLSVTTAAALYKRHPDSRADSFIEVSASRDGKVFHSLGRIAHEDFLDGDGRPKSRPFPFFEEMGFYPECRFTEKTFALGAFAEKAGELFLRIVIHNGVVEGFLNLDEIRLQGEVVSTAPSAPKYSELDFYARNLIRNCRVKTWRQGLSIIGDGVFAFAAPGYGRLAGNGSPANPPADLAAFKSLHPGIAPVYTLKDEKDAPALVFYDPELGAPGVRLSADHPEKRAALAKAPPFAVKSIRLSGRLQAPSLEINGRSLPIGVLAPQGSVLTLNPGGGGLLYFSPDFTDKGFDPDMFFHSLNVVPGDHPDYDGSVTCRAGTDCFFTFAFVSAFPIRELRIKTYPRVYGDAEGIRGARLSYSTDGKTYQRLDELGSDASLTWSRLFRSRFHEVSFDAPVRQVFLRFDMFADKMAEFWSHVRAVDRMYVEVLLDASTLPEITIDKAEFSITLTDSPANDVRVLLDDKPAPIKARVLPEW